MKSTSRTEVFKTVLVAFLIGIFSDVFCKGTQGNSGYLILAPAVFRAGVKQTITVRIFEETDPVSVEATLVNWPDDSIITTQSLTVQGNGKISLEVPGNTEGKAVLRICGNCHGHSGFQFQNWTIVTIRAKGASAFVQTDKPIYKPLQTVRINVFTVDRDLKPVTKNVTVYATAPNDVKIMEWRNARPTCGGTLELSFPLSDQPPEGKWHIFADLQGTTYNASFEVAKYVLPKFDVTIIPPPTFRDWSQCEMATVVAQYPFGKPVKGRLSVNITVRGEGYFAGIFDRNQPITRSMDFKGEAKFCVRLQEVVVDVLNRGRSLSLRNYFEASLVISATVTSDDGAQFSAYDDTSIVSRNYVDFEFASTTRKYFKQGIPFQGEIFVTYMNGTPADNIMLELKAEIRRENFATQNLISSSEGKVAFTIPSISEHVDVMWLEARVVAIDGEPTDSFQYLSKYHGLRSWYSPSECFLSIMKPDQIPSLNQRIELVVKSTCPCDFTLFYDLLSRGNILLSESKSINASNSNVLSASHERYSRPANVVGTDGSVHQVCQTSISFTLTAAMAPLAKLLVYYVRPNGEGVADSIRLTLNGELETKVQIDVAKQVVSPREEVPITVRTEADSCVCMGATDISLHYLKKEYLLDQEKILDEMYSYDMNNLPFEEERIPRYGLQRKKRFRTRDHHRHSSGFRIKTRDSYVAFLETGVVVMTDVVALEHSGETQSITESRLQQLRRQQSPKIQRKSRTLRAFFPETWYWKCFEVGQSGEKTVKLRTPDSITSWVINAVGTNDETGIGVAKRVKVNVRKKFFVDFSMPYSAIRGEELDLPVTIHNYLDSCTLTRLAMTSQNGVSFPNSRSSNAKGIVKYLCVDGDDTVTTVVKMIFSELGNASVYAVVDGVDGPNLCCGANKKIATKQKEVNASYEILRGNVIGVDALYRNFTVEPEGERREYVHSVFFCPNEKMNITTTPSKLHFITFDNKANSFSFLVKAANNVHIVLGNKREKSSTSYEIILGGRDNTRSWIQLNDYILTAATTRNVLSDQETRSFWIKWGTESITVGYGMEESIAAVFLTLPIPEPIQVKSIGLGTSGQSHAEFRLWSTEGFGSGFHELFQLDVPNFAIPDSVRGRASIIGDVMGPTLKNLNNLLTLPHGCGEQNMINFAPNIHIMKYLKATKQLTSDILNTARDYLIQGYQRQLTYRRRTGSYSAFGDNDEYGSMWLTAFVMKSYSQAQEFIYIDQREIDEPLKWIINQQMDDGSFPAHGRIMNKDAQAGINKKISLTAYVVIAILETKSTSQDAATAVERAVEFLQEVPMNDNDPYTAALLAYALTLAENGLAEEARRILLETSVVKYGGSYRYWSLRNLNGDDNFIYSPSARQTVVSAEIELASYALLAYTKSGDISFSLPIVRWITKQRNPQGGFASTQDTCAALQALSSYASFAYMGGVNLNISFGGDYAWNVYLNDRNSEILQRGDIPSITSNGTSVFVEATGDGCALLQINVQYNVPDSTNGENFALELSLSETNNQEQLTYEDTVVVSPAIVDPSSTDTATANSNTKQTFNVTVCGRWLKYGSTNMAVLEFPLLTGFSAVTETLPKDTVDKSKSLKKIEVEDSVIYFYFDEVSSNCKTCVIFQIRKEYDVREPSPRSVKLYDYYEPGYESSISYDTSGIRCANAEGCQATDHFPECRCYRECGFEGERICGDDGNFYENECRMSQESCEVGMEILPRHEEECRSIENPNQTDPPLVEVPTDYNYNGFTEDDGIEENGEFYESDSLSNLIIPDEMSIGDDYVMYEPAV